MNFLLVLAHPSERSFCHEILKTFEEELHSINHNYRIRDLYQLDFDPVLRPSDLGSLKAGIIPATISEEQEHILWADVLVFIYPIWWTGMPAIMKGYVDKVFSSGFAYSYNDNHPKGLLFDKKALILNTQGYTKEYYDKIGMTEALRKTTDEGIFDFCGIKVIDHKFFGDVPNMEAGMKELYLDEVRALKLCF
ncbi:MAG: NAD(P)H-dependent oxidoreductase [Bacteroidota bacterium]